MLMPLSSLIVILVQTNDLTITNFVWNQSYFESSPEITNMLSPIMQLACLASNNCNFKW